jgi:hypothetical protein
MGYKPFSECGFVTPKSIPNGSESFSLPNIVLKATV